MAISLGSVEFATAALPDVCVRHGLPATARQELALTERKKEPHNPMLTDTNVIGMADRAIKQLDQVPVRRSDWPLCAQCVRRRASSLTAAKLLALAGPLLIVAAIVWRISAGQSGAAGVLLGLGVLCLPLALWLGLRSRVAAIAKAKLSQDRTQVTIREPSEPFARQWHERNG